jgi:hypothetical protein
MIALHERTMAEHNDNNNETGLRVRSAQELGHSAPTSEQICMALEALIRSDMDANGRLTVTFVTGEPFHAMLMKTTGNASILLPAPDVFVDVCRATMRGRYCMKRKECVKKEEYGIGPVEQFREFTGTPNDLINYRKPSASAPVPAVPASVLPCTTVRPSFWQSICAKFH